MTAIQPFRINIPQADLDDLHARLDHARWPNDAGDRYGAPLTRVKRLADYWRNGYDWRKWEARLNLYPQFTTEIDGQTIHFLHIRSTQPNAFPLILTHGWPGSIVEYLDIIDTLTNAAFDLVIPSIPGFAFCGPTQSPGWGSARVGRAWAELMRRLGYTRYGAAGNDTGSFVSPEVGRADPDHCVGVHVTQAFAFPSGDPAEFEGLSDEDMRRLALAEKFMNEDGAYNSIHGTQPQTLAYAITDSPVGLLGWNGQLLGTDVSDDFVLTNVMIYWLTNTAGSSIRIYFEDYHPENPPTEPTTVPLGVAVFAGDYLSIRRFAERDHARVIHWSEFDRGGHYAAHIAPDLLTADLQQFFRLVR